MRAAARCLISSARRLLLPSGEEIKLIDKDDQIFDTITLPAGYMEDEPVRSVVVEGKLYVEGGGPDSFYKRGEFVEQVKDGDAS